MNFERPNEEHEAAALSVDKILERAILLRSMKNWVGPFLARHAAAENEQPIGFESSREDFFATITRSQKAAEESGDIEGAAKLEDMHRRFTDETLVPPEAQTMQEIITALGDEYARMAKLAREKSPSE